MLVEKVRNKKNNYYYNVEKRATKVLIEKKKSKKKIINIIITVIQRRKKITKGLFLILLISFPFKHSLLCDVLSSLHHTPALHNCSCFLLHNTIRPLHLYSVFVWGDYLQDLFYLNQLIEEDLQGGIWGEERFPSSLKCGDWRRKPPWHIWYYNCILIVQGSRR